jgi:hypothetical protein
VEYDRLCAARDWVRNQAGGNGPALEEGLAALQARMRELIFQKADADRRGGELRERVLAEIAPFLGFRAANRLLRSVSGNGQDLLRTVGPILANFLGDRAAAEVVSHLADTAMGGA